VKIERAPALAARIVSRRPMRYRRGADPALDRPAHVRAASSLVWCESRLIVVQDDAAFLAVVDPATGLVDDTAMAAGPGGVRLFGTARGNKRDKPDLEAAVVLGPRVIAIGSGGPHAARRVVVAWTPGATAPPETRPRPWLFDALARAIVPAGTCLNIEGATLVGDEVWLANRGGDCSTIGPDVSPDAIAKWPRAVFERAVDDAGFRPPPPAVELVELDGGLDGVALHLAEITVMHDRGGVWFAAAAEATRHAFDDGEVRGAVVGTIEHGWTIVVGEDGATTLDKIEGLAPVPGRRDRIYACVDDDDVDKPSDLLELALSGPW
jgi:hypothetical protein